MTAFTIRQVLHYAIRAKLSALIMLLIAGSSLTFGTAKPIVTQSGKVRHDAEETKSRIAAYVKGKRASVGVAWSYGGDVISTGNGRQYPLMSVFKLHVAVGALMKMEQEGIPLDTVINVDESMMRENTYSPLKKLHPHGGLTITMRELLHYSIAESDNNACDIIISFAGGMKEISGRIARLGIRDTRLTETEASMHADISRCYDNSATPEAVVRLIKKLYTENVLTGEYERCLKQNLLSASTGKDKIQAGLSPGMTLAHKTGSSDRLPSGVKIGDNDAGVIFFPVGKENHADGKRLYIAVLIKDSEETDKENARIIADITRMITAAAGCGKGAER